FFSSRRRHTRCYRDWSSDVCSSDLLPLVGLQPVDEGKTFNPDVLFLGGDGDGTLSPRTQVTAKVVGHVLGDKIRIGKRRAKTGRSEERRVGKARGVRRERRAENEQA